MFLYIPLLIIFVSLVGLFVIGFRKKEYLDKLYLLSGSEAEASVNRNFDWKGYVADFFPEGASFFDRFEINKHKALWLVEAEKLLRRTRLLFLRVDRLSDLLIKKIRRIHLNEKIKSSASSEATSAAESLKGEDTGVATTPVRNEAASLAFLKNEEERLIIEIAKNPKDAGLYDKLGDIYMEMNNFVDAKESYEAAVELSPEDDSFKQKLSMALLKLNPLG